MRRAVSSVSELPRLDVRFRSQGLQENLDTHGEIIRRLRLRPVRYKMYSSSVSGQNLKVVVAGLP